MGSEQLPVSIAGGPPKIFGTTTGQLHALRDWLQENGVRSVAMEATGIYWLCPYEVLEKGGPSLDFLGSTFRQDRDQYGRPQRCWNLGRSRRARARERHALRGLINPHQSHTPLPELIGRVNRQLRGWANYSLAWGIRGRPFAP